MIPAGLSGGVTMTSTLVAKRRRVLDGAGVLGDRHRGLVGGREHVTRRAVGGLLREVGARAERELHLDAVVVGLELLAELGEDVGQGGRGQHLESFGLVVARRP